MGRKSFIPYREESLYKDFLSLSLSGSHLKVCELFVDKVMMCSYLWDPFKKFFEGVALGGWSAY